MFCCGYVRVVHWQGGSDACPEVSSVPGEVQRHSCCVPEIYVCLERERLNLEAVLAIHECSFDIDLIVQVAVSVIDQADDRV